jgi:PKHD-type hydroxylase
MNLDNQYYYFQSVLPHKLCDDIIKFGESQNNKGMGITGILENIEKPSKKLIKKNLKTRNSTVAFLSEPWIYKEIHPYIHEANKKAGWNFDWDWSEPAQFTKYSLNQYYHWHKDSWNLPYNDKNNLNKHGKIRKLSVTCSLSDSSEYEGGDLEFCSTEFKKNKVLKCDQIKTKGSIVVFPSFVWHAVKPVTKGTRYSLVLWNLGYPYK